MKLYEVRNWAICRCCCCWRRDELLAYVHLYPSLGRSILLFLFFSVSPSVCPCMCVCPGRTDGHMNTAKERHQSDHFAPNATRCPAETRSFFFFSPFYCPKEIKNSSFEEQLRCDLESNFGFGGLLKAEPTNGRTDRKGVKWRQTDVMAPFQLPILSLSLWHCNKPAEEEEKRLNFPHIFLNWNIYFPLPSPPKNFFLLDWDFFRLGR